MRTPPGAIHVERRVRAALEAEGAALEVPDRASLEALTKRRRRSRLIPALVVALVVLLVALAIALRPDAPVEVDRVTGEASLAGRILIAQRLSEGRAATILR